MTGNMAVLPSRLALLLAAAFWAAMGPCAVGQTNPQHTLPDASGSASWLPPAWARVIEENNSSASLVLEVKYWSTEPKLSWSAPFPNVVGAYLWSGPRRQPLRWSLNPDATRLDLEVPKDIRGASPGRILLETIEKSGQLADGRIVFSALGARVDGGAAKLESQPGNHRIGFGTAASDVVTWDFKPTRWGMYDLELCYSAEGGSGAELQFDLAGSSLSIVRPSTESWRRYQTLRVGRVYVEKADPFRLSVSCRKLAGPAVMNLKAVTLRPAPEGKPITQDASGKILLHARDATTHSVMMRYEPQTNKNCLGYWVNPNDWAEWDFTVNRAGAFHVEIDQGCGKGQGGSEVEVHVAGQIFPFVVEDTGHFQNFVTRRLGEVRLPEAGTHSLEIRPVRKKAAAVMDVREVRLIPTTP